MKKVFTVLAILVAAILTVSATDTTVRLNVSIKEMVPSFKLTSDYANGSYDSESTKATITETSLDFSENDFTVPFAIVQSCESKYQANGLKLTIAVSQLSAELNGKTYSTKNVKIQGAQGNSSKALAVTAPSDAQSTTTDDATASFSLSYTGNKVAENTQIGSFNVTWAADDTLPPTVYTATVTLSYSAN